MNKVGSVHTSSRVCPTCHLRSSASHFKYYRKDTNKLYCSKECSEHAIPVPRASHE